MGQARTARQGRRERRSGHTERPLGRGMRTHDAVQPIVHRVRDTSTHRTHTRTHGSAHTLKLRGSVYDAPQPASSLAQAPHQKNPCAMRLSRDGTASAQELGTFLRKALGARGRVRVVFCPGMGGRGHADKFWYLWSQLGMETESWTRFAEGGQGFNSFEVEAQPRTHPAGLPRLQRRKVFRCVTG